MHELLVVWVASKLAIESCANRTKASPSGEDITSDRHSAYPGLLESVRKWTFQDMHGAGIMPQQSGLVDCGIFLCRTMEH